MKLHWWCKQIYRKILRWGGIVLFQRIEHDTAAHFQGDSSADSRPLPFKPYIWFILRLEWCGPQKEWSDFVHFSWYYAFLLTLLIVFFLCFTLCVMDKCLYCSVILIMTLFFCVTIKWSKMKIDKLDRLSSQELSEIMGGSWFSDVFETIGDALSDAWRWVRRHVKPKKDGTTGFDIHLDWVISAGKTSVNRFSINNHEQQEILLRDSSAAFILYWEWNLISYFCWF